MRKQHREIAVRKSPRLVHKANVVAMKTEPSSRRRRLPPPPIVYGQSFGTVVGWGDDRHGQAVPGESSPDTGFVAVAAGSSHSLGLKSDGTIVAWGDNSYGQCDVPSPNAGFVAVEAGWAAQSGAQVRRDDRGLGGQHLTASATSPRRTLDFVAVAGGWLPQPGAQVRRHDRGLGGQRLRPVQRPRAERRLRGGRGRLRAQPGPQVRRDDRGLGVERLRPVQRPRAERGTSWRSREARVHSLGLKSDGTIVAWGHNGSGQCNVPAPNADFVAVAGGGYHSLGLKSDGTIVAWG